MRILITGGSSFTGTWFVKSLSSLGHDVIAPLKQDGYQGIRKERVESLKNHAEVLYNHPFGSSEFLALIERLPPIDIFCHHAAVVTDYRSPNFDFASALAENTENAQAVLNTLYAKGCSHIILTGSVFESDEGCGSDNFNALSPYGLSKKLTYEAFRFFTSKNRMHLGKFVIPNPFGPLEEDRFTSYLMRHWFKNQTPTVKTPDYVRDNIPAPLLANAYVDYIERFFKNPALKHCSPSFYCESQKEFALRYANETRKRTGLPCNLEFLPQEHFEEPRMRVNTTPLNPEKLFFNEEQFFDENTLWYKNIL